MTRAELESLDKASLVEVALRLAERGAELEARQIDLERRFDELSRLVVRGAAPFSRPESKRSASPKRPGRKGGHEGASRQRHSDGDVDEWIEVPLERCTRCGAGLASETDKVVEQTLIEAPVVKALIIRLVTHRNRCACCGTKCASTHPLQVSPAQGAAGVHLGPRALALAAELNRGMGLTMRKTCEALRRLAGISLTPGGLSQLLTRVAGRAEPLYEDVLARLKAGPVLHTDETSWWVGGRGASLWVLTSPAGTAYRVVASKTRLAAEALLGGYEGVLVSDCLNLYDGLTPTQHKCYAHHLKAISKALENPKSRGSAYLNELRLMLITASAIKEVQASLRSDHVATMRKALDANAERLLGSPRNNPTDEAAAIEEKVRLRLRKQQDHLFTFLDHQAVPATNNLAERQLRPAVISRKLSCGNKTEAGAKAWEILTSIAATCRQTGQSFTDLIAPTLVLKPTA
jgi:transposase